MRLRSLTLCALFLALTACAAPAVTGASPGAVARAVPVVPAVPAGLAGSVLLREWNVQTNGFTLRPVKAASGQPVAGYAPVTVEQQARVVDAQAFSPDGNRLALVESQGSACEPYAKGTACRGSVDVLHLIDLRTWHVVTATVPGPGWAGPMVFSADGMRVAVVANAPQASTVWLFDTGTGDLVGRTDVEIRPTLAGFARNGQSLLLYGAPPGPDPGVRQPPPPQVVLLDAGTLALQWQTVLEGVLDGEWCRADCDEQHGRELFVHWSPALTIAHDGMRLYIVHADSDRMTTVDLDNRQAVTVDIRVARFWLDELVALTAGVVEAKGGIEGASRTAALSPDGTRLYVAGHQWHATWDSGSEFWNSQVVPGNLQVLDIASTSRVGNRSLEDTQNLQVALVTPSVDGRHVLVAGYAEDAAGRWFDAATLEPAGGLTGWSVQLTRSLDGAQLLLANKVGERHTEFAVVDPGSFALTSTWSVDRWAQLVTP